MEASVGNGGTQNDERLRASGSVCRSLSLHREVCGSRLLALKLGHREGSRVQDVRFRGVESLRLRWRSATPQLQQALPRSTPLKLVI